MEAIRTKYPRTPHLPGSPGADSDDIGIAADAELLTCADVVATIKMDGECSTIYPDGTCHARSADYAAHPSRTWMRAAAATIGPQLPEGWRLCGENLYAVHSIRYDALESWFYAFSMWDGTRRGGTTGFAGDRDGGICVDWDTTVTWAELLGVPTVEVFYRGPYDAERIAAAFAPHAASQEGFVVRDAGEIPAGRFARHVGKWVRAGHVTTDQHWMHRSVEVNGLARQAGGDAHPGG